MPTPRTATSLQRGTKFDFSAANPPVYSNVIGDGGSMIATGLNWKASLQGWTYWKESYIDVSGLTTTQDNTLFIASADVQSAFTMQAETQGTPATPYGSSIHEYFFVLDRPMSLDDFVSSVGAGAPGNNSGVGFAKSPIDQMGVIMGFKRTYQNRVLSSAGAASLELLEVNSNNTSLASVTASDRLYCYHIAWSYTDNFAGSVWIPDTRFVVTFVSEKEKDLVYLERLRRSYVQQQGQPDA